jgi:hypothetical protein
MPDADIDAARDELDRQQRWIPSTGDPAADATRGLARTGVAVARLVRSAGRAADRIEALEARVAALERKLP